jgi:hypothetical protein
MHKKEAVIMSRTKQDPGVAAIEFFKTAPLDVATFVLDLAKLEVKARQKELDIDRPARKHKAAETPSAE